MSPLSTLLILAAATTGEQAPSPGFKGWAEQNQLQVLILLVGFVILMWYFLIGGPQRKQTREREAMLSAVRKGDRVYADEALRLGHGRAAQAPPLPGLVRRDVLGALVGGAGVRLRSGRCSSSRRSSMDRTGY